MIGTCRLNNMNMRNIRRNNVYQGIIIDLALLGQIAKEEAELLIGGSIPEGITLPNGESYLVTEAELTGDDDEEEEADKVTKDISDTDDEVDGDIGND